MSAQRQHYRPTQDGLYRHFTTIADATDLPVVVYNIPSRTACDISNETMLRLASHNNIVGVKEATGSMARVMGLIADKPDEFDVICGDDNLTLTIIALGGTGTISVAANIAPRLMKRLIDHALAGDLVEARQLHYRLLPLFLGAFIRTNPIPIKYAMAAAGLIQEVYRLPLCPLDDDDRRRMDHLIAQVRPE
jgi:4-hydroxy-tetrahydrodipicolinate synthase